MTQGSIDYSSLGFPSAEYIVYNMQSIANYCQLNGGSFRMPVNRPLKKLPLVSLVMHTYKDGFIEFRLVPEEEYRAEKSLEKGLTGTPAVE